MRGIWLFCCGPPGRGRSGPVCAGDECCVAASRADNSGNPAPSMGLAAERDSNQTSGTGTTPGAQSQSAAPCAITHGASFLALSTEQARTCGQQESQQAPSYLGPRAVASHLGAQRGADDRELQPLVAVKHSARSKASAATWEAESGSIRASSTSHRGSPRLADEPALPFCRTRGAASAVVQHGPLEEEPTGEAQAAERGPRAGVECSIAMQGLEQLMSELRFCPGDDDDIDRDATGPKAPDDEDSHDEVLGPRAAGRRRPQDRHLGADPASGAAAAARRFSSPRAASSRASTAVGMVTTSVGASAGASFASGAPHRTESHRAITLISMCGSSNKPAAGHAPQCPSPGEGRGQGQGHASRRSAMLGSAALRPRSLSVGDGSSEGFRWAVAPSTAPRAPTVRHVKGQQPPSPSPQRQQQPPPAAAAPSGSQEQWHQRTCGRRSGALGSESESDPSRTATDTTFADIVPDPAAVGPMTAFPPAALSGNTAAAPAAAAAAAPGGAPGKGTPLFHFPSLAALRHVSSKAAASLTKAPGRGVVPGGATFCGSSGNDTAGVSAEPPPSASAAPHPPTCNAPALAPASATGTAAAPVVQTHWAANPCSNPPTATTMAATMDAARAVRAAFSQTQRPWSSEQTDGSGAFVLTAPLGSYGRDIDGNDPVLGADDGGDGGHGSAVRRISAVGQCEPTPRRRILPPAINLSVRASVSGGGGGGGAGRGDNPVADDGYSACWADASSGGGSAAAAAAGCHTSTQLSPHDTLGWGRGVLHGAGRGRAGGGGFAAALGAGPRFLARSVALTEGAGIAGCAALTPRPVGRGIEEMAESGIGVFRRSTSLPAALSADRLLHGSGNISSDSYSSVHTLGVSRSTCPGSSLLGATAAGALCHAPSRPASAVARSLQPPWARVTSSINASYNSTQLGFSTQLGCQPFAVLYDNSILVPYEQHPSARLQQHHQALHHRGPQASPWPPGKGGRALSCWLPMKTLSVSRGSAGKCRAASRGGTGGETASTSFGSGGVGGGGVVIGGDVRVLGRSGSFSMRAARAPAVPVPPSQAAAAGLRSGGGHEALPYVEESPYNVSEVTAFAPAVLLNFAGGGIGHRHLPYATKQMSQMVLLPFMQQSGSAMLATMAPATLNPAALSRELTALHWIGQGGGGAVFQGAWHGVSVAVKFLLTGADGEARGSPDAAALEGVVSSVVHHPNVLHTYAFECTLLTEASFAEGDFPTGGIEKGGTELLESLMESCMTTDISDSPTVACRGRTLPSAMQPPGSAPAPAAGAAMGPSSLVGSATVPTVQNPAAGTGTGTGTAMGTGSSNNTAMGTAALRQSRLGLPSAGEIAALPAAVLPIQPYSTEWQSANAIAEATDGSSGAGTDGAVFAVAAFDGSPATASAATQRSGGTAGGCAVQPCACTAQVGGPRQPSVWRMCSAPLSTAEAQTPEGADGSMPVGPAAVGCGGGGGGGVVGCGGGCTAATVATGPVPGTLASSHTTNSRAQLSSAQCASSSMGCTVCTTPRKENSTFQSEDGFGDPEANFGAHSFTVRQVLSYLRARPGMYMTYIIMEYCDRGSLTSVIKQGLFRASLRPENEEAVPTADRGAQVVAGGGGGGGGGASQRVRSLAALGYTPQSRTPDNGPAVAAAAAAGCYQALSDPTSTPTSRRVALRALLRTARDVAQGMSHLHANNIIHGDLKPGNVLLRGCRTDRRGFVAVVSDFGLSKVARGDKPLELNHWSTVTVMAPEVIMGRWLKASDVFSFGILLWQLVTGEMMPYGNCTVPQILVGVSQGTLRPEWPSSAHPALVRLGRACLATSPEKRPSFEAIVKMLTKIEKDVRKPLLGAHASHKDPSADPGHRNAARG